MKYTITLTPAEDAALSYACFSQNDWIQNAVHERCRVAIEEISSICIERCLSNNIQIPGSKEDMVTLAFEKGWVESAKKRDAKSAKQENI